MLSVHTVVYDSGVIARRSDAVAHRIDPEELARCERLAKAAASVMGSHPVGMKSEADGPFYPYFQVVSIDSNGAPPGAPTVVDFYPYFQVVSIDSNGAPPGAPTVVNATLVRKLFGHTKAPTCSTRPSLPASK